MRKIFPKIFFSFLLVVFLIFLFIPFVSARTEVDYPNIPGAEKPELIKTEDVNKAAEAVEKYGRYVFTFGIIAFGFIVLGIMLWGGILYITSVDNAAKQKSAREKIYSAFLGLIILFSSYVILTTINPDLMLFDIPFLTPYQQPVVPATQYPSNQIAAIFQEISLARQSEKVWGETRTNTMMATLTGLAAYINSPTPINPTFNRISDLNKYLKKIVEGPNGCRCEELTPLAGTPAAGMGAVGCDGDPCKKSKTLIDKITAENEKKIQELNRFKAELSNQLRDFDKDVSGFIVDQDKAIKCIQEKKQLLTRNEYLAQVDYYEKQGWQTQTYSSGVDSRADPLTFYCAVGGTLFDYIPQVELSSGQVKEILEQTKAPTDTPLFEPMTCSTEIPIGQIFDELEYSALDTSVLIGGGESEGGIIDFIDSLSAEIKNMNDLVSQCGDKEKCQAKSGAVSNPCKGACVSSCGSPLGALCCGRCSPAIQGPAVCNVKDPAQGTPCNLPKMQETLDLIVALEEATLETIKHTTEGAIQDAQIALKNQEIPGQENSVNLDVLRTAVQPCFSQNPEEPVWQLLNCLDSINNVGPDGQVITDCHPQSFFCCTSSREAATNPLTMPSALEGITPSYVTKPTALSGTCNDKIIQQAATYKDTPYCQIPGGKHCSVAKVLGLKPGQGHCYDEITYDKPGVKAVDCSGFASRVYRDVGIFPAGKCYMSSTIKPIVKGKLLQRIYDAKDVQKGDLVWSEGHIVIYAGEGGGDVTKKFSTWQSGGGCSGGKVCLGTRKAKSIQRYFRRVNDCGTHRRI